MHFELSQVDQLHRTSSSNALKLSSRSELSVGPRWLHTEMCSFNENKGDKIIAELRARSARETWARGAAYTKQPVKATNSTNNQQQQQQLQQHQQQQQQQQQQEQQPVVVELSIRDDSSEPDTSEPEPDDSLPRVSHSSNPVSPSVAHFMQFSNSHFVRLYPKGTSSILDSAFFIGN